MNKIFFLRNGNAWRYKPLLLMFLMLFANSAWAQAPINLAGMFGRTLTNGNLAVDKDGNPLDMSTGTTGHLAPGSPASGTASNATNIEWPAGFTFVYPTNTVSAQVVSWSVASNGCIGLSNTTASAITTGNNIAGGTGFRMGAFITGLNNGGVSESGIVHSKVFGTSPNQVFVVEFSKMRFINTSTNPNGDLTYQIRFYENGNLIEFVYGDMGLGAGSSTTVRGGFSTNSTAPENLNINFSNHTIANASIANSFNVLGPLAPFAGTTATSRRVYQFSPTAFPQQFLSSSFSQFSGVVATGAVNQVIARLEVSTTGTGNPLPLTALEIGTEGTNPTSISNLKVFYTGGSTSFSDTAQFGTTIVAPGASNTITGNRSLLSGSNYFWVTYDIPAAATFGDTLRAVFNGLTLAGINRTPVLSGASSFRIVRVPLSGTYTVGNGAAYPNLGAAFADVNAVGLSGNATLAVVSDITEPAASTLFQWNEIGAGGYTLTIRPAGGQRVISGSIPSGVIVLFGADRVIIDGRLDGIGNGRDLTIRNEENTVINAAVLIAGTTTAEGGCDDVTIRNTILMAGPTLGTTLGTAGIQAQGTGAPNNNLVITQNEFKRAYRGIFVGSSTPTSPYRGLQITENIIGSDDPSESVSFRGIQVNQSRGAIISHNHIKNIGNSLTVSNAGIELLTGSDSATIEANKISGVRNPTNSGYGAYGIHLAAGSGHLVVNNDISDITTTNYSATSNTFNAFGIRIITGTGHRFYHNTVNMSGEYTGTNSTAGAAALCITAATVTAEFQNNVFSNTITSSASGNKNMFAIWLPTATFAFTNLTGTNNNNYFIGSEPYHIFAQRGLTFNSGRIPTFADWQAASVLDANSSNVNPRFLSARSGLPNASAMDNLGVPIAGISTDINGATRSATTPDLGAYEFTPITKDLSAVSFFRVSTGCFTSVEEIRAIVSNEGVDPIVFDIDTLRITVQVSGATTTTINYILSNGVLAPGDTMHLSIGAVNMTAFGNYTFNGTLNQQGDGFLGNNVFATASFTNIAPVALPFATNFDQVGTNATQANLQAIGWSFTGSWIVGANNHGNPGNGLYSNIYSGNATPSFTLPLAGSITANTEFKFSYRLMNWSGYPSSTYAPSGRDSIWFEISDDCGVSWQRLYTIDSASHIVDAAWRDISVPLTAYTGQNVIVRLRSQWATGDFFLDLDNIEVTRAPLRAAAAPASTNVNTGTRGPNGTSAQAFLRIAHIVTRAELAAVSIENGTPLANVSLRNTVGASVPVRGRMIMYLRNAPDTVSVYSRGAAWADAIQGLQVVHDDSLTVRTTPGLLSLPFAQPFIYTGGALEVAFEWVSVAPFATTPASYAGNTAIPGSSASAQSATVMPDMLNTVTNGQFRPELTWGADDRKANDLEVIALYARGKSPIDAGAPEIIQALVRNNGFQTRTNSPVTLSITGANNFTNTQTIASLGVDEVALVNFSGFSGTALGFNNIVASVPNDDAPLNNSRTWMQQQTENVFAYNDTVTVGNGSVGYNTGSGLLLSRFSMNGMRSIRAARMRIGNSTALVGNSVYAVVLNDTGAIIAQSAPITLATADLSTWKEFVFLNPVGISNASFYIGIAQTANATTGYFPLAFQAENPTRANAYFTAPLTGGAPAQVAGFRLMIEALLESAVPMVVTGELRSRSTTSAVIAASHNNPSFQGSMGVVYGTTPNPTVQNNNYWDASANNNLVARLDGLLQPGTTYYARAYAQTQAGQTTYSNEIVITTFSGVQSLPITPVFSIIAPQSLSGPRTIGFSSLNSGWGYNYDTLAVQAPLIIARAPFTDSLGCEGPIMNASALRGKIAVVYRGGCEFATKAYEAYLAGAVGVVIVNNTPGVINMGIGAMGGMVPIPVVMISDADGAQLRAAIDNGNAVAFMGNKNGEFAIDLVLIPSELVGPDATHIVSAMASQPGQYITPMGAYVYNAGKDPISQYYLQVSVLKDVAGQNPQQVYNNFLQLPPSILPGDFGLATMPAIDWGGTNFGAGNYTIRYNVQPWSGATEGFPQDNVVERRFSITDSIYSKSTLDSTGAVIFTTGNRPMGAADFGGAVWLDYQGNATRRVNALRFGFTTNAGVNLAGELVEAQVLRWDDTNNDGEVNGNETTLLGSGLYSLLATDANRSLQVDVQNSLTGAPGVDIVPGNKYLLGVYYYGSNQGVFLASDPSSNYAGTTRNTTRLISSTNANGTGWNKFGFGPQIVFAIAAVIGEAGPANTSITGVVTYDNNANTPMNNTQVMLFEQQNMLQQTTTDGAGMFDFGMVPPGSYTLRASTNKMWGGVNATDALAIARHFTSAAPLLGLRLDAADVNASETVNATDALQVARRFTGLTNSFPLGDWIFKADGFSHTNTQPTFVNMRALAVGDVNASYTPGNFRRVPLVAMQETGSLRLGSEAQWITVETGQDLELGAVSLDLTLPQGVEVLQVKSRLAGGDFSWNVKNGVLLLSWYSLSAVDAREGTPVVDLLVRSQGTVSGSWQAGSESELANGWAEVHGPVQLRLPRLVDDRKGLFAANAYPNPTKDVSMLSLNLPDAGKVNIRITDALGRVVFERNDSYGAGSQQLSLPTDKWAAGSYHISVQYEGATTEVQQLRLQVVR